MSIVGASDDSYPLQKKGHTPEFLREIAPDKTVRPLFSRYRTLYLCASTYCLTAFMVRMNEP